jgi:acyl dehydratase
MAGQYYEDLVEGWHVAHAVRRTVTETDNLLITTLTHNPQPLHLDAEYAAGTEFGRVVVNSIFTFGLMVGVSVADTTLGTLVANLGFDAVKFPAPVFVGDTLRTETRVVERRESRSRPDAGIVVFEHHCFNQRGQEVASCRRTALMRKRPA